jgi:DUF1365 family protein
MFSVHPKDYLSKMNSDLREKFQSVLKDNGITDHPRKVWLHTVPKFLGQVFNPVSFYIGEGITRNVFLMEINNTFGEKHSYACTWDDPDEPLEIRVPKAFHVSPFNPISGNYVVRAEPMGDRYSVQVNLENETGLFFESTITWVPQTWKFTQGFQILHGLGILLTTFRIIKHAAILYFRKKMKTFDLPTPPDKKTIRWGKPILLQRLFTGEWLERFTK